MLKLKIFNYQVGQFQEKIFQAETAANNQWIIGRTSNCDLVLPAPEVSRIHGKIDFNQGNYYYTDLGSTDGSKINNQRVIINQKHALNLNDIIHIGDFVLAVCELEKVEISSNLAEKSHVSYWNEGDLMVRCVRIIQETQDVKTFSFVSKQPVLFSYLPGQFVNLELEINGQKVQRSYSISSSPSRPELLEITVKRVGSASPDFPPGLVSNWLHDNLEVGSVVKLLDGPMGKFTCGEKPERKLLLISAGSGITPMISMTRWLYDQGKDSDVVFFHSARTPDDLIMGRELELMASRRSQYTLAITMTQSQLQQSWLGLRGRLSREMLVCTVPDWNTRDVYVCGPEPFMESVKAIFTSLNFPMENYYQESFGPKKKTKINKSDSQTLSTPRVIFQQSQKTITCQAEDSILATAQKEGVKIRAGCLQGVCGACKKRKITGSIRYEANPEGLESQEQEQGYILPCIAFPVGEVVVEA